MDNNLEYIDALVNSSLQNYEVSAGYNDWEVMQKKLKAPAKSFSFKLITAVSVILLIAVFYYSSALWVDDSNFATRSSISDTNSYSHNSYMLNNITQNQKSESTVVQPDSNQTELNISHQTNSTQIKENKTTIRSTSDFSPIENKSISNVVTKHQNNKNNLLQNNLLNEDFGTNIHLATSMQAIVYEGCTPFTVSFDANVSNAISYSWNFGNGYLSTKQSPTMVFHQAGVYLVAFEAMSANGQTFRRTDTVKVYASPTAKFELSADTLKIPGKPLICKSFASKTDKVQWNFGDKRFSNQLLTNHNYTETGHYSISLSVWNENNCFDSITIYNAVSVVLAGDVKFPNAFTPSTDGANTGNFQTSDASYSLFYPSCYGIDNYILKIYDRNGVLVFETTEKTKAWDGYFNQKLCKQDIYIWLVQGRYTNGEPFTKRGDVMLIRK